MITKIFVLLLSLSKIIYYVVIKVIAVLFMPIVTFNSCDLVLLFIPILYEQFHYKHSANTPKTH